MKAVQKKIIYDLLKTASSYIQGVPSKKFPRETPCFTDDIALQNVQQKDILPKQNCISIKEMKEKIASCKKCSLYSSRKNIVIGQGVSSPLVLVVGEAPGEKEDETGLPFVGAAGILLDKMLFSIQLSRKENCYIANIMKCRPPQNRTPEPAECLACFPYLKMQIDILKPKAILAMGRVAAQTLLSTSMGISYMRAKVHNLEGLPLVATYHPSALLRNPELKKDAWQDLKLFARTLRQEAIM